VRIVQSSNHPVWNLQEGRGIEAGTPEPGDFPLVRGEGLTPPPLVIPVVPDVVRESELTRPVGRGRSPTVPPSKTGPRWFTSKRKAQSLQHKKGTPEYRNVRASDEGQRRKGEAEEQAGPWASSRDTDSNRGKRSARPHLPQGACQAQTAQTAAADEGALA
jgi:hypothetical protein